MRRVRTAPTTLAGAIAAVLLLSPPVTADLVKCHNSIEKNTSKLSATLLKALVRCKNTARKATTLDATVAGACQSALTFAVDNTNSASALARTKLILDSLVTKGTCTDDDLGKLGHLGTALFGDRWERWLEMSALRAAWEQEIGEIEDMAAVFLTLGKTGSCPLCTTLSRAPCLAAACSLSASAEAKSTIGGTVFTIPLTGVALFAGCEYQNLFSNELAVVGVPNIGIKPATVIPGFVACTLGFRTEGVSSCSGSTAPAISYTTCQDHNIESGDDECEDFLDGIAAGKLCQPDFPDTNPMHAGITTGGACALFQAGPPTTGASFALNTTQLTVVNTSTQNGADGIPCTPDDTATPAMPAAIPITTGTVRADVFDYNNQNGNQRTAGPITGAVGPGCPQERAGNLSGLTLVGAFPAIDTPNLGDSVTSIKVVCN